MESIKERMAKAATVAVRRPSITRSFMTSPAPSEGVVQSRPTVSPVELPSVVPIMLHSQPCSVAPQVVTLAEPAVHVYATMKQD
jgi:hypothetical protein